MLKGDLATTPLAGLLLTFAQDEVTGCLHVASDPDEATVYFKHGDIYAVSIPGLRSKLGAKLVSSGALTPDALADALEAQRTELHGWKLGELLVHMGYVDQPVVEAFVKEQVDEALWDLLRWVQGTWKFRVGQRTREDVAPPRQVTDLFGVMQERNAEWESIASVVHGPGAVPALSAQPPAPNHAVLDADVWSMLCKIDGQRTLAELARDGGYTLFEAGQVLVRLVQAGLVEIADDGEAAASAGSLLDGDSETGPIDSPTETVSSDEGGRSSEDSEDSSDEDTDSSDEAADSPVFDPQPEDALSRLARLVSQVQAGGESSSGGRAADSLDDSAADPNPATQLAPMMVRRDRESFAASIARVSAALSEVLGAAPQQRTRRRAPMGRPKRDPERAARIREANAAELADAQELTNQVRDAVESERWEAEQVEAERVDREAAERQEAERAEAERAEAERAEAERAEAERQQAERLEAERLEAERMDAERREAEAAEAERVEAERQEAERLAAEQAELIRLDNERAEAERVEAERVEAERVEAERVEAERREAERREAERVEAERAEAERAEAERREAELLEAERLAAEQREAELAAAEADRRARKAAARALLSELSTEPAVGADEVDDVDDPPVDRPDSADAIPDRSRQPVAVGASGREFTDTAALLRELASLGGDEPARPPTAPAPRPPRQAAPAERRKKRGLFGR